MWCCERGIKTWRRRIEERGRGGERERIEKNNYRLWKRDKLSNKECIHERRRMRVTERQGRESKRIKVMLR